MQFISDATDGCPDPPAELAVQPKSAINAMLGWVHTIIAGVMLPVAFFHPIEQEMAALRADRG